MVVEEKLVIKRMLKVKNIVHIGHSKNELQLIFYFSNSLSTKRSLSAWRNHEGGGFLFFVTIEVPSTVIVSPTKVRRTLHKCNKIRNNNICCLKSIYKFTCKWGHILKICISGMERNTLYNSQWDNHIGRYHHDLTNPYHYTKEEVS